MGAKLREALSAQPAPIDPRELQRAIDRISVLQSTNKTLLDQLEQQQNERRNLVEKVVAEEAQRALAEANQQLQSQRKTTSLLQREKADIEAQLTKIQDADLKQLKSENISLKAQVSELTSDTERGRQIADLSSKLSRLQSSLEEAQQRNGALAIEKSALEKQLADAQARVEEEGIVKISKLEVDLAVARADAGRNSLRAEELVGALQRERLSRTELENKNQQLETRIAALGNDTKDVPETLNSLQQALGIEKAERTQIESQLKAAELQIVALQSFRTPNATVTPLFRFR